MSETKMPPAIWYEEPYTCDIWSRVQKEYKDRYRGVQRQKLAHHFLQRFVLFKTENPSAARFTFRLS